MGNIVYLDIKLSKKTPTDVQYENVGADIRIIAQFSEAEYKLPKEKEFTKMVDGVIAQCKLHLDKTVDELLGNVDLGL